MHAVMYAGLRTILLATCLVVSGCGAPKPEAPVPSPAIWRLSDEDSTVWLFGSVHILTPDIAWRSEALQAAFGAADVVVFEIVPDAASAQATEAAFLALGRNPPGVRLSSLLLPQDADLLGQVSAQYGLSLNALEPLRPWLAGQQIAIAAAVAQGARPELGVEAVLGPEARARGAALEALETPLAQIETLANLSPDAQRQFFVSGLRQLSGGAGMAATNAAWASGDVAALEALLMPMLQAAGPEVEQALIANRNRAWTPQIEAYLARDEDVFVAVGTAHLIGPGGVISLLRARGHAVEGP